MFRALCHAAVLCAAAAVPAYALEKGGLEKAPQVAGVINHGHGRTVALTFDACPRPKDTAGYDPAVIEVLRREKVPATIFVSGLWAAAHAEILKALAADPLFEIGNHGHRHEHMAGLALAADRRELARAQETIQRIAGRAPTVWRPPYGEVDTTAVRAAASLGLTTIDFSLASGDPDKRISARRLTQAVVENARPGSIIVFHVNGNGVHTAEALPGVIDGLRKRGFTFVQAGSYVTAPEEANAKTR